ncbi:S-adenosyl-L-methionine-dependent methyltransferase [Mollisia scopiformis]|uniref:S-adenosyl-L-methionine-dependent methyltransferase n=1 Tax=Mollisia scopiformis TaxID=149040 RepID=A0A132BAD0_MOLSC|nr:S-adenosyl-L-methionine-dependent methyltransferase [Mollisia scopiformis]KUJ09365.1 S-adenosyl-L-methionine-dependent methyltransferase [Mollisia scopiformis]
MDSKESGNAHGHIPDNATANGSGPAIPSSAMTSNSGMREVEEDSTQDVGAINNYESSESMHQSEEAINPTSFEASPAEVSENRQNEVKALDEVKSMPMEEHLTTEADPVEATPGKEEAPASFGAAPGGDVAQQSSMGGAEDITAPAETQALENPVSNVADSSNSQPIEYESHPDIEVDSNPRADNSDADSAIGSMPGSSTVSLRESVFNYIEENGRTYHAFHAGKYVLPNDEVEQERLDLQHHLFVMTMNNKLHLAPLKNPQNVLDIATGTGIWAIEFAEEYPSAAVLGTDLSPIQPAYVPANCRFEINDAEEEWIFSQPFDYIHGRALVTCFRDPPSVIASIYENLVPGGWFEFQDPIMPLRSIDGSLEGTAFDEYQKLCMEAGTKLGRPWTNGKNYGRWMREQGFVDVTERSYYWATNQWVKGRQQKLQALWLQENLKELIPAWGLGTLSRTLGWSRERIEILIARAREDLKDPNIHAYAECYVAYGRKPHSTTG